MTHNQLFWLYTPITILVPSLLTVYVGWRWVLRAADRTFRLALAWGVLFPAVLFASLALIFWGEQDRVALDWLLRPGFLVLGFLLTALPLLLAIDLLRLSHFWLVRRSGRHGSHAVIPTLKTHANRLFAGLEIMTLVIALGCLIAGSAIARRQPTVVNVVVLVKGLEEPLQGLRILQLSDIHLRGKRDQGRLEALVNQVNSLSPDLIAITGDIVDGPLDNLRKSTSSLARLKAKDGVYLVLGNHEYYADANACATEFARLGLTVLLDEHRVVTHNGAKLVVAGVVNPQEGMHGSRLTLEKSRLTELKANPQDALTGAPIGPLRILLAHQPKSAKRAQGLKVALALTGHTHGGQYFPWNYLERLVLPYVSGLYLAQDPAIYVSPGIGTFGPPLRLGVPPEITLLTLKADASAP